MEGSLPSTEYSLTPYLDERTRADKSLPGKNDKSRRQKRHLKNQVTSRHLELGRFGRADSVKPVTGTAKANMVLTNSWYGTHL